MNCSQKYVVFSFGYTLGEPCYAIQKWPVAAIDAEIAALEKAWLSPLSRDGQQKTGRNKRHLSPEGRARIVAAVTKRWAAQKDSKFVRLIAFGCLSRRRGHR